MSNQVTRKFQHSYILYSLRKLTQSGVVFFFRRNGVIDIVPIGNNVETKDYAQLLSVTFSFHSKIN